MTLETTYDFDQLLSSVPSFIKLHSDHMHVQQQGAGYTSYETLLKNDASKALPQGLLVKTRPPPPSTSELTQVVACLDGLGLQDSDVQHYAEAEQLYALPLKSPPLCSFSLDGMGVAQVRWKVEYDTDALPKSAPVEFVLRFPHDALTFAVHSLVVCSEFHGVLFHCKAKEEAAAAHEYEQAKREGKVAALLTSSASCLTFAFTSPANDEHGLGVVTVAFESVSNEPIGAAGREFDVPMLQPTPREQVFVEVADPTHVDKKRRGVGVDADGIVVEAFGAAHCRIFAGSLDGGLLSHTQDAARGCKVYRMPPECRETLQVVFPPDTSGAAALAKQQRPVVYHAAPASEPDAAGADAGLVLVRMPAFGRVIREHPPARRDRCLLVALDVSSSMLDPKFERWSKACEVVVQAMRLARDEGLDVAIVEWSDRIEVRDRVDAATDLDAFEAAIRRTQQNACRGGGTHLMGCMQAMVAECGGRTLPSKEDVAGVLLITDDHVETDASAVKGCFAELGRPGLKTCVYGIGIGDDCKEKNLRAICTSGTGMVKDKDDVEAIHAAMQLFRQALGAAFSAVSSVRLVDAATRVSIATDVGGGARQARQTTLFQTLLRVDEGRPAADALRGAALAVTSTWSAGGAVVEGTFYLPLQRGDHDDDDDDDDDKEGEAARPMVLEAPGIALRRFVALTAAQALKDDAAAAKEDRPRVVQLLVDAGIAYPGFTALVGTAPPPAGASCGDGGEWVEVEPEREGAADVADDRDEKVPVFRSLSMDATDWTGGSVGPYRSLGPGHSASITLNQIQATLRNAAQGKGRPVDWLTGPAKFKIANDCDAVQFVLYLCNMTLSLCQTASASDLRDGPLADMLKDLKRIVVRNSVFLVQSRRGEGEKRWVNFLARLYNECTAKAQASAGSTDAAAAPTGSAIAVA